MMSIAKTEALSEHRGNFDAQMYLNEDIYQELDWWIRNVESLSAPIVPSNPSLIIYTDASLDGWGVSIPDRNLRFGGRWLGDEGSQYIN